MIDATDSGVITRLLFLGCFFSGTEDDSCSNSRCLVYSSMRFAIRSSIEKVSKDVSVRNRGYFSKTRFTIFSSLPFDEILIAFDT